MLITLMTIFGPCLPYTLRHMLFTSARLARDETLVEMLLVIALCCLLASKYLSLKCEMREKDVGILWRPDAVRLSHFTAAVHTETCRSVREENLFIFSFLLTLRCCWDMGSHALYISSPFKYWGHFIGKLLATLCALLAAVMSFIISSDVGNRFDLNRFDGWKRKCNNFHYAFSAGLLISHPLELFGYLLTLNETSLMLGKLFWHRISDGPKRGLPYKLLLDYQEETSIRRPGVLYNKAI